MIGSGIAMGTCRVGGKRKSEGGFCRRDLRESGGGVSLPAVGNRELK